MSDVLIIFRKVSRILSYVAKLIPTAIGPFTQFILSPLKKAISPSSLKKRKK